MKIRVVFVHLASGRAFPGTWNAINDINGAADFMRDFKQELPTTAVYVADDNRLLSGEIVRNHCVIEFQWGQ